MNLNRYVGREMPLEFNGQVREGRIIRDIPKESAYSDSTIPRKIYHETPQGERTELHHNRVTIKEGRLVLKVNGTGNLT